MSEEFAQKIGRGGAGNFYTKKELELALAQDEVIKPQGRSITECRIIY
jgi:hypothetical protein